MTNEKIKHFPITMYAMVMGLSGFAIVLSKFYHLQWTPKFLFDAFLWITFGLFVVITFFYGLKTMYYPQQTKADYNHPIRVNFFSAISISMLLLSIAFMAYWPFLSMTLWWMGVISHSFFMFHTIAFWIQKNFEIQFMNPAWFIPVVGNILVPVAGVEYMPISFSYFYFAAGFFFWIVLFTVFLNRAVFHHQLPQKFIPTLFILIAPPAVGFIAYMRITQSWDGFALFMLMLGYFFVVLLFFLRKSFYRIKFFMSWWAFTFPITAITIASAVAYQITDSSVFKYLAFIHLLIAVLVISYVIWKTIEQIRTEGICIEEE
ncbi:MAG: SLAC1 anion channel family protein [Paludibacteraceae bacterium]|nr:SLAC1 anion channel family protein [Paludibacteraceae bacterium]MBN2787182.1 SLAC1 anion channel family protein [Paludibacteraceae bacterium]